MNDLSSAAARNGGGGVTDEAVREVVLQAMRLANLAREEGLRLEVAPDAPIFGADSPLDSLGLVALLLDIEDGLRAIGCDVVLGDERAMSQRRSPFRSVRSLVGYITGSARE
jgi:acyl carrier protein